jgi:hypothetical protein
MIMSERYKQIYLKLKYGLSLLKIHEKCKKYTFRIIFYVSVIKNDKQTKKGKEINISGGN